MLDAMVASAQAHALDMSTNVAYDSHIRSYNEFINLHHYDPKPTPQTLARYLVWNSHYVKVSTSETYLAGIVQRLRPIYPEVKEARNSEYVKSTIHGLKRLKGSPAKRKLPLSLADLERVVDVLALSDSYDDKLFLSLLLVGFFGLLRLGELVDPADQRITVRRKTIRRDTLRISESQVSFILPASKTDKFFAGNQVLMKSCPSRANPVRAVGEYLHLRDKTHSQNPYLWVTAAGQPPNRRFFMHRFRKFFDAKYGGHSMRAGGATLLAQCGADWNVIQSLGRWSSETFRIYIRQHPMLLFEALNRPFDGGPH